MNELWSLSLGHGWTAGVGSAETAACCHRIGRFRRPTARVETRCSHRDSHARSRTASRRCSESPSAVIAARSAWRVSRHSSASCGDGSEDTTWRAASSPASGGRVRRLIRSQCLKTIVRNHAAKAAGSRSDGSTRCASTKASCAGVKIRDPLWSDTSRYVACVLHRQVGHLR